MRQFPAPRSQWRSSYSSNSSAPTKKYYPKDHTLSNLSPPTSPAHPSSNRSLHKPTMTTSPSTRLPASPKKGECLQFVPAYPAESSTPSARTPLTAASTPATAETSWDALSTPESPVRASKSVVGLSTTSSLARASWAKRRGRSIGSSGKSEVSSARSTKSGTRIARLASLFGSNGNRSTKSTASSAAFKNTIGGAPSSTLPTSPSRSSESSSGYTGWPGTQDKRGGTVAIQSSYEDSDANFPSRADQEVARWMDDDEEDDPSVATTQVSVKRRADHADYHVSAIVGQSSVDSPLRKQSNNSQQEFSVYGDDLPEGRRAVTAPLQTPERPAPDVARGQSGGDPWSHLEALSDASPATSNFSKSSSAYFNPKEAYGKAPYGIHRNRQAAASVMRGMISTPPVQPQPQPPTEEALRANDHLHPAPRTTANAMGFRALWNKTQDVPNLMDAASDVSTSVSGIYSVARHEKMLSPKASSDVFEGVTTNSDYMGIQQPDLGSQAPPQPSKRPTRQPKKFLSSVQEDDEDRFSVVLLGGGLTTIQTTAADFSRRRTATDFDETLSNSDCDQNGFVQVPGFGTLGARPYNSAEHMQPETQNPRSGSDSGSSLFSNPDGWAPAEALRDLSQYYVPPEDMKAVVRKFRKLSKAQCARLTSVLEREREEDAIQAFALAEMRSRIMESDMERGLERRGGTAVVDDLVLTPHFKATLRVRDALVVAKAWRDGAAPKDVVNTSLLTRRPERSYYIPRYSSRRWWWEEVRWMDDLSLSRFQCASIGSRCMRGFEMFTIGDCQSILLRLANQQCVELRETLHAATARQLEAEERMQAEGDRDDGMMTDSEIAYLNAMQLVKSVSHKLVVAEKSFTFVKDGIEKLVAKYEAILVRIENDAESVAPSSIITYQSSYYSDYDDEEKEREMLERRAQRAELRAELAAREAMLAKQDSHEKELQLQELRKRLQDLQSEASTAISQRAHSVILARAITSNKRGDNTAAPTISKTKIEDVKQRFRARMAARVESSNGSTATKQYAQESTLGTPARGNRSWNPRKVADDRARQRSEMFRTVGEEMFQHLDFYERSLKAVESSASRRNASLSTW